MQIFQQLDAVCRKAVNASLFFKGHLSRRNPYHFMYEWTNKFMKTYYPLKVVLTQATIMKQRFWPTVCTTYPVCRFYPFFRSQVMSIPDLNDPQFVICSKPRETFNIMPPPDMFTSFRCNDGSLIASASHCDGYNDCPDSEDEHNCTDVCSLRTNDCFTSCI